MTLSFEHPAPVHQKADSTIHRVNHYPVDSAIDFYILILCVVIYPMDSTMAVFNNWGLM